MILAPLVCFHPTIPTQELLPLLLKIVLSLSRIKLNLLFLHYPYFSILDSLESLYVIIHLTPPQIAIGQKITLISNISHVAEVFTTPIMTFEETLNQ